MKEVRQTCLRFYEMAAAEMKNRFPLKPSFIDELRDLMPNIAFNVENKGSIKDL